MDTWSFEHGMTVRRRGSGPELLWIHGLGDCSLSVDPLAAHPALAGFSHTLVDLPGYGRSPWSDVPPTIEALAAHLAAWIGSRAPFVIGHSMGGMIATLLAERIRLRGVINVEGNLTSADCGYSAQAVAQGIDAFVARGFAAIEDAIYPRGVTEPASRAYYVGLATASPHAFYRHAESICALSAPGDLAARFAKLPVPARYIAGGAAGGISADSRAVLDRAGVRWLAYDGTGHCPHIEQPDRFAADVAAALRAS